MFGGFIDTDKPFWKWVCKLPELVVLTLCWFICCIPVVTIIPSSTALFDAVARYTAEDEKGSFSRFFKTFVKELKQGIPVTLFWLALGALLIYGDMTITANVGLNPAVLEPLSAIYKANYFLYLGVLAWIPPLQARFYNSFGQLHLNAMKLFLARLPHTVLMLLELGIFILLFWVHPIAYILIVIAPAVVALLHSYIVDTTFHKAFPEYYAHAVQEAIGASNEPEEAAGETTQEVPAE